MTLLIFVTSFLLHNLPKSIHFLVKLTKFALFQFLTDWFLSTFFLMFSVTECTSFRSFANDHFSSGKSQMNLFFFKKDSNLMEIKGISFLRKTLEENFCAIKKNSF